MAALASQQHHHNAFKLIMDALSGVLDAQGSPLYRLTYKILNSKEYGDVPQSRPRVYIIGLTKTAEKKRSKFLWPCATATPSLGAFLGDIVAGEPELPRSKIGMENYVKSAEAILSRGGTLWSPFIADLGTGFNETGGDLITRDVVPCLTRTRCGSFAFYSFTHARFLQLEDFMALQGVPPGRIVRPQNVSERQLSMMIGNGFTVCISAWQHGTENSHVKGGCHWGRIAFGATFKLMGAVSLRSPFSLWLLANH